MPPKAVDFSVETNTFPPFEGFSKEGIIFLRELAANNSREWFQPRKEQFEELVKFPAQCLVATLGVMLRDDFPSLEFNPKKSIFRIYRDTRFSKNKDPYKTNVGAQFTNTRSIGVEMPGLYVHVAPDDVFAGGGLYMPDSKQLRVLRESIVADADAFLDVINDAAFKKLFGSIEGEKLAKAPKGFAPDHPMIEHLKHKQFFVGKQLDPAAPLRASFAEDVAKVFRTAQPLMAWLEESLVKA